MRSAYLLCLGAAVLSLPSLHTSTQATYHSQDIASSITVTSIDFRYPGGRTFQSIRDVDFANMPLVLIYGPYERGLYQLQGGQFALHYPTGGGESVSLDRVSYFTSPPGKEERAMVSVTQLACGASCSENGRVIVFELRDGRLFETEDVTYDHQAPRAGVSFSPKTGVLVITGRFEDQSARCCPDAVVVVSFKWDGSAFRAQCVKKQSVQRASY